MSPTRPLILLVCGSDLLNALLQPLLNRLPAELKIVPDAAGALELAARAQLILVELLLADVVGFQLLRRLRADYSGPLVLLSGSDRRSDEPWALGAGATCVLSYPLRSDSLLALLPATAEAL